MTMPQPVLTVIEQLAKECRDASATESSVWQRHQKDAAWLEAKRIPFLPTFCNWRARRCLARANWWAVRWDFLIWLRDGAKSKHSRDVPDSETLVAILRALDLHL